MTLNARSRTAWLRIQDSFGLLNRTKTFSTDIKQTRRLRWHQHTNTRHSSSSSSSSNIIADSDSNLPRFAQPSLWQQIFPQSLRDRVRSMFRSSTVFESGNPRSQKAPNPATYFIWIYLLIGSQAIRILGVQNEFSTYMRRADLQIEKLREVIRKLQAGEPVDVEKVLGTGDESEEQAWEEALREIEAEELQWQKSRRERDELLRKREDEKRDASPVNGSSTEKAHGDLQIVDAHDRSDDKGSQSIQAPGFY